MRAFAEAMLGVGEVRHARLRPVSNAFAYPTYFLLLPLRSLRAKPAEALPRNRFGLISFHDADHGDGRRDCLAWLEALLAEAGIGDASGEIWLHCYPRVLGYSFKPVSFWYCQRDDDSLAAVVVEVNNTFGERHCYLLQGSALGFGREVRIAKAFHVSPFCSVAGEYRFRFMHTGLHPGSASTRRRRQRTVVRVDHHDSAGLLLQTSVSGELQTLSRRRLRVAFFRWPLLTLAVVARIHWQALKLCAKGVPFFRKPALPRTFVSR